MKFTRPEITDILIKINDWFYYKPKNFNVWDVKYSIFDIFWTNSNEYKENFVKYINKEDKRILKEDVVSYDDYELFKTQFYTTFNCNNKVGNIFASLNSYNLFFIMYKNSKSMNKYWIKRYLLKEYIESDELPEEKIEKLKEAITDYYTNEDDINKYILWNNNFIYSDYSEKELDTLFKMWLFIKDDDLESKILTTLDWFELVDVIMTTNTSNEKEIFKGEIFANDILYECFLYIYNNAKSFRKLKIRKESLYDFLEKDYIWVDTAIKYIDILVDYMKDLDEVFSSPFHKLLDSLFIFNDECKKEYDEINNEADKIYSDIELKFLWLFYDVDRINWYKYFDNEEYMDSDYLKHNEENQKKWIWLTHSEYNNFLRN